MHVIKTYGKVKAQLHALLLWALFEKARVMYDIYIYFEVHIARFITTLPLNNISISTAKERLGTNETNE